MPIGFVRNVPNNTGPGTIKGFTEPPDYYAERNYTITGVTKDSTGVALGSCVVKLFNNATDILVETQTSDTSGNYSFTVDKTQTYYVLAYKAGGPDVAGTTVNTISGA